MTTHTRIALFNDDSAEGGAAVYTHALACGLAQMGYQVTCVQTETQGPMIEIQRQAGVHHHWLPFHTRKDFARTMTNEADADAALTAIKPDIVVFSNCDPYSHIAAKSATVRHGTPFVIVENYVWPIADLPKDLLQQLSKFLPAMENHYRHAKAVVAVSKDNLDQLRGGFKLAGDKGEVIHYGRPDTYFAPRNQEARARIRREFQIPEDAVLCLTVGRLEEVKGHQLLQEAMRLLSDQPAWRNLYFAWVGKGSLAASLKASMKQAGLQDRVVFPGYRSDVIDWLDASDIFILPSLCEGMPLSAMEAMAKGLPVLATAVSGTPEELGDTGCLVPSPLVDADKTVEALATQLNKWATDSKLRDSVGAACRQRALAKFRENRMVEETHQVIERALLPKGDYVSPGLRIVRPDACFPNMIVGDTAQCKWPFVRREVPHNWYVDKRIPQIGFVNRDEAHILYNTALAFRGKRCLEIGCWLGWSTCHLALGGVDMDVMSPALANAGFLNCVRESLNAAGLLNSVNLINGSSPQDVEVMAWELGRRWSLFFIDGEHGGTAPIADATVCAQYAEPDALILFHDLAAPEVAHGMDYLRYRGWNTMVYSTMQIMGVAWRGAVTPVAHRPDPSVHVPLPAHLGNCLVSGVGEQR